MNRPASSRLASVLPWWAALLALAAGLPCLGGGFVWDDRWLLLQSPLRHDPGLLPQIVLGGHGWGTMTEPGAASAYYRPLANLLHGLLLIAVGAHALPFRILSLATHAACAFLLAVLLRRAAGPRASWGALLFAAHPVAADTTAWIAALPDSLAGAFLLGSMIVVLGGGTGPWASRLGKEPAAGGGWRCASIAGALWLLALLSKESALVGVAWLPLLAAVGRGRAHPGVRAGAPREVWIAFAAALAVYAALRLAGPGFRRPVGDPSAAAVSHAVLVGRVFLADALALLAPVRLYVTAPGWVTSAGGVLTGAIGLLSLAAITAGSAAVLLRRDGRWRPAAIGALITVAALLPALQIVRTNEVYAGRFLYLPLIGLSTAVGLCVAETRPPVWLRAAAATLLLVLAAVSGARAREWRSDASLFTREYERNPASVNAGRFHAGQLVNSGRHEEARPVIEDLERRAPSNPSVRYLRAMLLMNDGRVAEAGAIFEDLERDWAASPTLLANLATCRMRTGRVEEGLATLDRAMRHLTPTPGMRNNRGLALQLLGRSREALEEFARAIVEDPTYEPARVNYIRLLASGDDTGAEAAVREGERFLLEFPHSRSAPVVREILDSLRVSR